MTTKTTHKKSFKDFKHKYTINKTLRFSLIPEEKTKEILEIENKEKENFKKDRKIADSYKRLKVLLNELHQEFIYDAMSSFKFKEEDLKSFEKKYLEFLNFKDKTNYDKKNKLRKSYEKEGVKLAQKIKENFSKYKAEKYKNTFTKKNILDKEVFDILKEKYKGNDKNLEIIETFDKFATYLTGFKENRGNFYKGEMKSGQFATRVIENLIQFIKNKKVFLDKYKDNYLKIGISEKQIKIFDLNYFNNLFLQDGLDYYNGVLGGEKGKVNSENKGINEIINTFKQKEKRRLKEKGKKLNKSDYPFLKELYKQIGSIKKENDVYIEIKNDEELVSILRDFPAITSKTLADVKSFYQNLFKKIKNNEYDLDKIYLPKSTGIFFSHLVFSDWGKLAYVYNKKWENKDIKLEEGDEVNSQYRSLADIKRRIEEILNQKDNLEFNKVFVKTLKIDTNLKDLDSVWVNFWLAVENYINSQFDGGEKQFLDKKTNKYKIENFNNLEKLENDYKKAVKLYNQKMNVDQEALTDNEEKDIKISIKNYLDRIKEIERIGKYFDLRKYFDDKDESDKDGDFYKEYQKLLEEIMDTKINTYYNEFRNYLTQSNLTEEKIKLNFNSGQLLGGWDLNMEKSKFSIIFRDEKKFYLGIINKNEDINILDREVHPEIFNSDSNLKKMELKYLGDIRRQLPRIAFSKKAKTGKEDLGWTQDIQDIKDEYKKFQDSKKDDWELEFDKEKSIKLINYYKQVLKRHSEKYAEKYNIKFKESEEYGGIGHFNDHVQKQIYKVKFTGIDKNYIDKKIENGELFLFQIYNKDFSENKKKNSSENLETIYFKELFSKENLENPIFFLGANAEVFFRDAIEKKKQKTKKDNNGKIVTDKKRFSKNTILFHVPIQINYGKGDSKNLNKEINNYISKSLKDKNLENIKILGIDRGEKHLLYYSLINDKGEIEDSGSLNTVDENGNWIDPDKLEKYDIENSKGEKESRWRYIKNGKEIKAVNYHQKLDELEKNRQRSRQSWQKIDKIKNLKQGYISHVIKKIIDLAIENNAIIILEDLNFGFKSFRQKIEKNVYQQFEKALIDKLGFLVDKKEKNQRFAPQLSAPFKSFKDMGKQTGIVYYVLAANTSKVCPSCQWRKNIYPRYVGKNTILELKKQYKMKMFWDEEYKRFVFSYKADKKSEEVYSNVDRLKYDKSKNNSQGGYLMYGDFKENNPRNSFKGGITENISNLLKNDFDITDFEGDILKKIQKQIDVKMWEPDNLKNLICYLNLILNIRNSMTDSNEDFIQCPSCFFDTRKDNDLGIKNGDDNGAYNIALRGRYLVKKIMENPEKPKLIFDNNGYFQFIKDFKKLN